jgi:flagellar protein FliO/FliZ
MESLFGAEMPLAVRFFLAFLIVLGLIGAIAWGLRRFGAGRFRDTARGRQPRLAVIDHASVDGRRRLILVRRDNVEHLLMIGGPSDIVVEPNIVRAVASPRDVPGARPPAGIEALPRAIPLPENGGAWPLQPEPASALRPAPRLEPLPDELPQRSELPRLSQPAEPPAPPRPQRETLAALADELGSRPAPPPRRSTFARPEPRAEAKIEARADTRTEPELDMPIEPPQAAPAIVPPPAPPPAAAEADQSLADMASRLEAALRKPGGSQPAEQPAPRRPAPPPRSAAPPTDAASPADTLPPLPSRAPRPPSEPKRTEPKPGQSANQASNQGNKTALYDSLEQEMASLLGRPNKT